jgi:4-amino-4-deoxy-L-arabinose transferase-like glycosyltransferase
MNVKLALVVLPVLAEGAFLALTPQYRRRLRDWTLLGLVLAPLGLLWPLARLAGGMDVRAGFQEMLDRARGVEYGLLDRRYDHPLGNAWYYARIVLFGAYPQALAFPLAMLDRWSGSREEAQRLELRLLGLYVLAVFAFYTAVSRRSPWYVIPALPPLCVLLGAGLDSLRRVEPGAGRLLAVAGLVAIGLWVEVDLFGLNPFAHPAVQMPVSIAWRPGAGPGLLLSAGALAAALCAGRSWLGRRFAPLLFAGVTALLLGTATVRVLAALKHSGYVSEMERLSRMLDQAKAAQQPLPRTLTVRVPGEGHFKKVWFYFGQDYRIAREVDGAETVFRLHRRRPRSD